VGSWHAFAGMAWDTPAAAVAGVTGFVLHAVLLAGFLVGPVRACGLPRGAVAAVVGWDAALTAAVSGYWLAGIAAVVPAVAGEGLAAWIRSGGRDGRAGYRVLAGLVPALGAGAARAPGARPALERGARRGDAGARRALWPGHEPPGAPAPPPGRRWPRPMSRTPEVPPMLDKVLVLSASAGAGHVRAAQAIERALVMVIVNPIPGQEERNADHLLEEGVATRCNNLPVLPDKIERLLADPARLAAMRANVRRLARPRAAGAIVDALQAAGP
jgi:hypothetical protein